MRHQLKVALGAEAALLTKTSASKVPWWVEFLDPLAEDDLRAPSSRTTSAVLAVRLADAGSYSRMVCFTFGYGRHLLDPARLERDFGLRLALNAVDPKRLRGFDARRQDDVVVNSRVQASAGTELASFDLDIYRDIFKSAAGATRDEYSELLGSLVRGSVSVTFDVPIEVDELAKRAKGLLRLYRLPTYRESFPFVDYVRSVDPDRAAGLDELLEGALTELAAGRESGFRCLYMAVPEVLDMEQTEGFTYTSEYGPDRTVHTELALADYLATRTGRAARPTVDRTRSDRVMRRGEGLVDHRLASVYRCLIAELEDAGRTYQLVDGTWYAIDADFATSVRLDIARIPASDLAFPEMEPGEREASYNARAAVALDGLCLDASNVSIGGGHGRLEVCDMTLPGRNLVFAKKRSSSSTLSHLWFQATVSLQAMLSDGEYRQRVRDVIETLDGDFVETAAEGLGGGDFIVTYLVLGVDATDPVMHIPFFSQVALWQATRTLRGMGVSVRVAGVAVRSV